MALLSGCGASLQTEPQAQLTPRVEQPEARVLTENVSTVRSQKATIGKAEATGAKATLAPPAPLTSSAPADVSGEAGRRRAVQVVAAITPGNPGYKIGPLDVLEVSVFKVPELSKTVQVAENGSVNLPLVGEVPTVGRTAQDVERELTQKLGAKYLQSPQVTVFVKEFNSQRITVEGAVKKPGVYPLRGRTTLMQAVAMSEGMDQNTASSSIAVFHQGSDAAGKRAATRYEIDDIRSGKAADPDIVAGDLIVVDTSPGKEAFNNFVKALPVATILKPF